MNTNLLRMNVAYLVSGAVHNIDYLIYIVTVHLCVCVGLSVRVCVGVCVWVGGCGSVVEYE